MLRPEHLILPAWPAPSHVKALQTTRLGGLSQAPFDTLNLGTHVGDDPMLVAANRQRLNGFVPSEPVWMEQVHGTEVILAEQAGCVARADAAISRTPHTVCTVMTADCLPVLLCDDAGTVVGAAHAGWRGLADGVIEATVTAMAVPASRLIAWLGPAIGPEAFEVGHEVRETFVSHTPEAASAFVARGEKYLANLELLARQRLAALGVLRIHGGGMCTYADATRFYSYRRDGQTGRMATMIWLGRA